MRLLYILFYVFLIMVLPLLNFLNVFVISLLMNLMSVIKLYIQLSKSSVIGQPLTNNYLHRELPLYLMCGSRCQMNCLPHPFVYLDLFYFHYYVNLICIYVFVILTYFCRCILVILFNFGCERGM